MKLKNALTDYTEVEYLEIIQRLFKGKLPSEEQHDELVDHIVKNLRTPEWNRSALLPRRRY
ncbi:bacteriocin immunity protein [Pseudomonas sp. DTU12.3]|uniref:bacteriocin immunity protein n=1 Tax=Pseudomonas sp. DTU12.3 TaxID=2073078 RepID=UPI0035567524